MAIRSFIFLLLLAVMESRTWSESISWCESRESTVAQALDAGRLILLLAGRESCGNCQYMKYTVCESASIRAALDADYTCWFCPVDTSTEWHPYASGLGSFSLPLICVIDPGDPSAYLDRTTGIQEESAFLPRVQSHQLPVAPEVLGLCLLENELGLEYSTSAGGLFRLLSADSLDSAWHTNGTISAGTGNTKTNRVPLTSALRFFKVFGYQ